MEPAATNTPQILLVEDDSAISEAISENLRANGYNVAVAQDSTQGLELALSSHPALILLDYSMPGETGLQMLEKLREDPWGKSAQVVFLTNTTDVRVVNGAMRNGVSDFVIKSEISTAALLKLVASKMPHSESGNTQPSANQ